MIRSFCAMKVVPSDAAANGSDIFIDDNLSCNAALEAHNRIPNTISFEGARGRGGGVSRASGGFAELPGPVIDTFASWKELPLMGGFWDESRFFSNRSFPHGSCWQCLKLSVAEAFEGISSLLCSESASRRLMFLGHASGTVCSVNYNSKGF